jgi:hypothetical protein
VNRSEQLLVASIGVSPEGDSAPLPGGRHGDLEMPQLTEPRAHREPDVRYAVLHLALKSHGPGRIRAFV